MIEGRKEEVYICSLPGGKKPTNQRERSDICTVFRHKQNTPNSPIPARNASLEYAFTLKLTEMISHGMGALCKIKSTTAFVYIILDGAKNPQNLNLVSQFYT